MLINSKLQSKSCCYLLIIDMKNASLKVNTDEMFAARAICNLHSCCMKKALVFSQSEARKSCILLMLKSGWWWPITFENLVIVLIKHGISDVASYGRIKHFSSYAERDQRHAYTQTSNECLLSPSWGVRAILELPWRTEVPLVQSTLQWPLIKHSQV